MPPHNSSRRALPRLLALLALCAAPLAAQTPDTAAASPAAIAIPATISGTIFGNYAFQAAPGTLQQANANPNGFVLDRAYLTVRLPAGDRTSVRLTTDIYQATDDARNAYSIRAKYAYLQYDAPVAENGHALTARVGIIQTVLFESQEAFWLRYLSQVATERAGYFASADAGIGLLDVLPRRMGEVYATVTNGPGYTSRERDRFKDYAIRLTLTPLANSATAPTLLQTLTFTAWGYKGATASAFVNGGAGQLEPIGRAVDRSRAGLFAGIRDPRLVLAGELATRRDGTEDGANTAVSPVVNGALTGHLRSVYFLMRPTAFTNASGTSRLGVVARYDKVSPTARAENTLAAPAGNAYHNLIAGLFWDLSQRAQLALDYQESLASNNGVSSPPPVALKGWFAHFTVSF